MRKYTSFDVWVSLGGAACFAGTMATHFHNNVSPAFATPTRRVLTTAMQQRLCNKMPSTATSDSLCSTTMCVQEPLASSGATTVAISFGGASSLCMLFVMSFSSRARRVMRHGRKPGEVRIGMVECVMGSDPDWMEADKQRKAIVDMNLTDACNAMENSWYPDSMASRIAEDWTLPKQIPMQGHLLRKAMMEMQSDVKVSVRFIQRVDSLLQLPVTVQLEAVKYNVDVVICIYRVGYTNPMDVCTYETVISGLQNVALKLDVPIISHNLGEVKPVDVGQKITENSIRKIVERIVTLGKLSLSVAPQPDFTRTM